MIDASRVNEIVREAMETILLPLWQQREQLKSYEKTPGELVTSADLASQEFISKELRALCPTAQFLGEELQNQNHLDMNALDQHEQLWIVDPLDGTLSYAAGDLSFTIMVAFVEKGTVRGAWIAVPQKDEDGNISCSTAHALSGQPAFIDGIPFSVKPTSFPKKSLGVVGMKYFDSAMKKEVADKATLFGGHRLPTSAGFDLLELAKGSVDFLLYNRTLPWDFAAPLFWGTNAGLFARRFSGDAVTLKPNANSLLCTRSREDWKLVHAGLIARTSHHEAECKDLSDNNDVCV